MKNTLFLIAGILFLHLTVRGQFAPQAGLAGSTAIIYSDAGFTGWATGCTLYRGLLDIANPGGGNTTLGGEIQAVGQADGDIVSLGDSGIAVLTFAHPIYDGPGADIAVFENGFRNPADSTMAFLELAFVEVSSDGVNYTRFPATSNTPVSTQVPGSGVYMNASLVNNLAGKYVSMQGTPFDLSELAGSPGLDINNITHVRVIDVVGTVGAHASHDHNGNVINDPYPTAFAGGGFDLDAVGALHQMNVGISGPTDNVAISIFPNPATDKINIAVKGTTQGELTATLTTITGTTLLQTTLAQNQAVLSVAQYAAGIYYLVLADTNGNKWVTKVIKGL